MIRKIHLYKSYDTEDGPKSYCGILFNGESIANVTEFSRARKPKKCSRCWQSLKAEERW
ncbi:hypothetical protein LCGC14_0600450 [marine sediment metagenome]|uniref:Uncharacterized protein n=1 Tax=marine sediment metagenome TaxID=412755 RepID=A0A0F9RFD0_9ZZZZ